MKTTFTGFSTVGSTAKENFKLYNLETIKQGIMNNFQTRIGERVMRPEYGCRIWDYLMEPFTDTVKEQIIAEATRILESDPRVTLVQLFVTSYDSGIRIEAVLNYVPLNTVDQFIIDFDNRQSEQGF